MKTASTLINVQILDTNDLDPFFNPSFYSAAVPEDTQRHAAILTVSAEDADSGVNGEVYYSIAEDTDLFSVHPVIIIIYSFKFEQPFLHLNNPTLKCKHRLVIHT